MLGYLGLFVGLAILIGLALRSVNIILASLISSILVVVTNGLPIAQSLNDYYTFGDLGAFTFAGRFFLLFAAGAVFGKIMDESHAATSIAMALMRSLGTDRALWITVLACSLLTYGGVVAFVVIFAMYPLGLRLLKEADIPKRLFCGACALGAGTFTLTALPGTPSIHNVIPAVAFGTNLFAGAWLGVLGGSIMFALGMLYLERERKKAKAAGEGFRPGPSDSIPDIAEINENQPHWAVACVPLIIVIGTIITPRVAALAGIWADVPIVKFANAQPILWPSIALLAASLVALLIFASVRHQAFRLLGDGVQNAIMPLMATASVIGFGGVVVQTPGYQNFADAVVNSGLPPMLSMFSAISVISGITGSASGGLQIFVATLGEYYLEMGVDPSELHRLVAMASGGFDSLPHCGGVIALLMITGVSHREAYKDIFVVTVIIPVIATLTCLFLAMAT